MIEKNLYIVTYKYKEQENNHYEYDNLLIRSNNEGVHGYMNQFRKEFMENGYDMEYSFIRVDDKGIVEV